MSFCLLAYLRIEQLRYRAVRLKDVAVSDLAHRKLVPEIMDQPGLDPREHVRALGALARINILSRSAGLFWPEIARVARAHPGKTIRFLDVASGGGDVPIQLLRKERSLYPALDLR